MKPSGNKSHRVRALNDFRKTNELHNFFSEARRRLSALSVESENNNFLTNATIRTYYTAQGLEYAISGPNGQEKISVENNSDEVLEYDELSQDIFSLLFVSPAWSRSFFFAIICIFFQLSILCLLFAEMIDNEFSRNPLKIPSDVTIFVRIAQFIAIILAAFTAEDLIDGLGFLRRLSDINEISIPNGSRLNFIFAATLKFIEGSMSLVVIFILIVQAEKVQSLFLNFAALSFIWSIDDLFYQLAMFRFFRFITKEIYETASKIEDVKLPKQSMKSVTIRNSFFWSITFSLIIGWLCLTILQLQGYYMCQSLLVQFDDGHEPVTSRFSGVYDKADFKLLGGRVFYKHEIKSANYEMVIGYCEQSRTWTLTDKRDNETYSPCSENRLAESRKVSGFDISETFSEQWIVNVQKKGNASGRNFQSGFFKYEHMSMECLDCNNKKDPNAQTCNGNGICNYEKCECNDGNYGMFCQFSAPCEKIGIIGPTQNYFDFVDEYEQLEFSLLRNSYTKKIVKVMEKAVYFRMDEVDIWLLLYNGLRWVLINNKSIDYDGKISNIEDFLETQFHPHYTNYTSMFLSEMVLQGSSYDNISPAGKLIMFSTVPSPYQKFSNQGELSHFSSYDLYILCLDCSEDSQYCGNYKCVNQTCVVN